MSTLTVADSSPLRNRLRDEWVLFQILEGVCSAGCSECYERPGTIMRFKQRRDIIPECDLSRMDNKYLASMVAEHQRELGLEMKLADIQEKFAILAAAGIDRVSLAGSEPTGHSEFVEILDAAAARGLKVRVYTNGMQPQKLLNPAVSVAVLHLDYHHCGEELGREMVGNGTYPGATLMEHVRTLIDRGIKVELRVNFRTEQPLLTPDWQLIQNFYGRLSPAQQRSVLLKYSLTVRVAGAPGIPYATPESVRSHAAAIVKFVDEFRAQFAAPMLSERPLFRCAFSDDVWAKYQERGGFRSSCGMEYTFYRQGDEVLLGLCPPARSMMPPRPVRSIAEFLKQVTYFQIALDNIYRWSSFDVCDECDYRGRLSGSAITCYGGCLGNKVGRLVQLGF